MWREIGYNMVVFLGVVAILVTLDDRNFNYYSIRHLIAAIVAIPILATAMYLRSETRKKRRMKNSKKKQIGQLDPKARK